ncbi:MAG: class I SAM-dependent methyltransferase [Candidatus Omnitrophica bacterium]|nr:class I SAM-dependent methyltransferase [Candidatus Omnitrophota bacterium]
MGGNHNAPSVLMDAVLCWPLLKNGGILIFDDYLWKINKLPEEERPKNSNRCIFSN